MTTFTPPTPTHSRVWAPAFTLFEIVVVLSLVAVFILMAGHLWRANHVAFRSAERLTAESTRFDLLLDRLARDAWSAQEAVIVDHGGGVILKRPDAPATIWRHTEDGQLQRLVIADRQMPLADHTWPPFTRRITFASSPAGLNITLDPTSPPLTLRLMSNARHGGTP